MHSVPAITRYTGTQVCGDPVKGVYTVLLTARVYNSSDTSNSTGIHFIRKVRLTPSLFTVF